MKSLTQTLVNIRDEFIKRYPENHQQIMALAEETRQIFESLFSDAGDVDATNLKLIKEGVEDELGKLDPSLAQFAEEYRTAINLLCYQWADPGLNMIEWGQVDEKLPINLSDLIPRLKKELRVLTSRIEEASEGKRTLLFEGARGRVEKLLFRLKEVAEYLDPDQVAEIVNSYAYFLFTFGESEVAFRIGYPISVSDYYNKARYARACGKIEAAIENLEEGLALHQQKEGVSQTPLQQQHPDYRTARFACLLRDLYGHCQEKLHYAQMAAHHQPGNPENWRWLAQCFDEIEASHNAAFEYAKKAIVVLANPVPFRVKSDVSAEAIGWKVDETYAQKEDELKGQLEDALRGLNDFPFMPNESLEQVENYYWSLFQIISLYGKRLGLSEWESSLMKGCLHREVATLFHRLGDLENERRSYEGAKIFLEDANKKAPFIKQADKARIKRLIGQIDSAIEQIPEPILVEDEPPRDTQIALSVPGAGGAEEVEIQIPKRR